MSAGDRQPEGLRGRLIRAAQGDGGQGAGGCAYRDAYPGAERCGLAGEPGDAVRADAGAVAGEVAPVEGPVPRDAGIGDVTVEYGLDLDGSAPSGRAEGALLGGEVGVRHVNEPGMGDAEPTAVAVLEQHAAGEGPRAQVQDGAVVAQARVVGVSHSPAGPSSGRQR